MKNVIIIKDTVAPIATSVELVVNRLYNRDGQPRNKIYLFGPIAEINVIHDKLFKVVKGYYKPNPLGQRLGANISASSFTIDFKGFKIKDIVKSLKVKTVRVVRYQTF